MWIVALALRRPYTFVVVALLLLIVGPIVIYKTPTDIFPNINIPVVSVLWNYQGLNAPEMADRIVSQTERALTTTVDDIQHSESQSLNGIAVVKVFFQPHANIEKAIAQITAISQTQLRQLPAGTTPPLVITYSASSVPILQLALSGQKLSEQQLCDYGVNFIRTRLVTIPGCAIPWPYGGKQRQVQVDLDTNALQSKGLSPVDVVNAINVQNLILPSGTSKIGGFEYNVDLNGSPQTVAELNDLPIKRVGNTTIYIRDVAYVRDGFPPQTNIVRVNGHRASLLTIQKNGNASTLDIISGIKSLLPHIMSGLPPELKVEPLADQSLFVRASIDGVVREALIAACLTGFMILVFLGSWRSTVIIAVSIPLSILTSIIVLSALGETINIMTLGGLALAVGILVDDATVEIENINRNIAQGKEIQHAILDGAQQIAVPAFVSTLAICIVFVPMFFLTGVARYLFVPLAEAVVFAMLASYLLSRTLVPTMAKYLLRGHEHEAGHLPPDQIASIIDNIGLPYSSINLSYSNSAPTGPADADILVTLSPKHRPTDDYVHDLRLRLREAFSGVDFSFLPADIVSQILNFGLPSPIDIQVVGYNLEGNRRFADKLLQEIRMVPGTADLRIQQPFDQPYLHIDVDRTKAQLAGFTQRDIAQNLLISLSGSFQTSPSFWLDPKNGVSYSIATQTPQYRLDSLQGLENIPVTGPSGARPEILASLASIHRGSGMSLVSHYDIQPVVDIYGSVARRDLGGVANDISKIVDNARKELPRGSEVNIRGQVQTMKSSYSGLLSGLAFAILLVYLLIVVNFQSWLDPFIIISALPAALAGIVWCLFVTHTRISVPSLTGSIMCMGVATANSILVVSFAKEQMSEGGDALSAALQAAFERFRRVLMTALAMMIGMVPMAIGLGEGGEQNAPLGRAVIGGLVFATAATLFFVPVFFSVLHGRRKPEEIESQR